MTPVKRSLSSSPPSSPVGPPNIPPSTGTSGEKQSTPKKAKGTPIKKRSGSANAPKEGEKMTSWTASLLGDLLEDIIALGYKAADLDALADKYGMTKRQLASQLAPNRSNLRAKAVKLVKGQ